MLLELNGEQNTEHTVIDNTDTDRQDENMEVAGVTEMLAELVEQNQKERKNWMTEMSNQQEKGKQRRKLWAEPNRFD